MSWKPKTQPIVAACTAETEYVALAASAREYVWLEKLHAFVTGLTYTNPPNLFLDNQGSIKRARSDASGSTNINFSSKNGVVLSFEIFNRQSLSVMQLSHLTSWPSSDKECHLLKMAQMLSRTTKACTMVINLPLFNNTAKMG